MNGGDARLAHAREAYLWACGLDVAVHKPGNVSLASPGHGMSADHFLASASASAPALLESGASVGERIEAAVDATLAVAGCNTNLGIVLLCAPLAQAWERCSRPGPVALRACVEETLAGLDLGDTRAAFRAIASARPAGLGRAEAQDVAAPPTVDLRAAMGLAAARDRIALQYRDGYPDVFGEGLAALAFHRNDSLLADAVQRMFLAFLGAHPDSHIVRKLGGEVAHTVTREAARWSSVLHEQPDACRGAAFARWDESLKRRGINPGTSADLCVCTLFLAALIDRTLLGLGPDSSWHGICMVGDGREG